jgi:hypothetical protein
VHYQSFSKNHGEQTAITRTGYMLKRTHYNGSWGVWRWLNPPMQPGVEYATTEEFTGIVYAKRIQLKSFDNIPETGDYAIPHSIANLNQVLRVYTFYAQKKLLPWFDYNYENFSLITEVNDSNIILRNKKAVWSASAGLLEIVVHYTKTTF